MKFPTQFIETDRLILRNTELEDAGDLFSIGRNKETAYWTGMEPFRKVWDARKMILAATILDDMLEFGIKEKDSDKFIGLIKVSMDDRNGISTAVVGYFLSPEVTRRGYMSEAVSAVCKYIFANFSVDRIMCEIRPDNIPSRGVARKCGFIQNPEQTEWRINRYGKTMDEFILTRPAEPAS